METSVRGTVPIFGPAIQREHLLKVFLAHRPALTLACAPPGYGKSILAAQLVDAGEFACTVWISAHDEDMDSGRLLVMAAQALVSASSRAKPERAINCTADAWLAIRAALTSDTVESTCVVFDGCHALTSLAVLQDFARLLREATSNRGAVIATCRSASLHEGASLNPADSWIVEEQDLRFTEGEALSLYSSVYSDCEGVPLHLERLLRRFGGHPALTALMLRHAGLDDEVRPPQDLVWYVDQLVSALPSESLKPLYAASLLQEEDLAFLDLCTGERRSVTSLTTLAPLLSLLPDSGTAPARFRVHAVLRDVACSQSLARLRACETAAIRGSVIEHLLRQRAFDRIRQILLTQCTEAEVAHWSHIQGLQMLASLGPSPTSEVVKRISPQLLFEHHDLLLLLSKVQFALEQYDDAFVSAKAAACIAETEGHLGQWATCILMAARSKGSSGDFLAAHDALATLDGVLGHLTPTLRTYVTAYAAVVETQLGNTAAALARAQSVDLAVATHPSMDASDAFMTVNAIAGVLGMSTGLWSDALRLLAPLSNRQDLSPSDGHWLRSNLAVCKMELGCLQEAKAILDQVIEETESVGCWHTAGYARGTRSNLYHALGDEATGDGDYQASQQLLTSLGHHDVASAERLNAALNLRAARRLEESLALAEQVELIVPVDGAHNLVSHDLVECEVAASVLALGDVWGARKRAEGVLARFGQLPVHHVRLRADLLLAEIERIDGDAAGSRKRVLAHSDYLMTGSANWLTAMYVRAFPGLLGVLTRALGAENIPLRMLLMIPIETIEQACEMEPGLSEEDAAVLRRRGGSDLMRLAPAPTPELNAIAEQPAIHSCYVRLFGGLDVTTHAGKVDDASWRKRKARLVFAILVLKQHQDVPRDVLLEHLWPEMDEKHAKRNFYVTWSTMKRALACGGSPSAARQYVQCTGGVCRATQEVRSDVDDFDEAIAALRGAFNAGDTEATLVAAQRLVELYRGELLPGDLYEEWFAEVRERTKHDFCDAMMCAATAAEDSGDAETALFLLRRAALADPWREDVYQSTMRCQMHSGQRSRAIETYLSCRSRLTEDLGIDPSIETTRIYQSVLAMEESTSAVAE